METAKEKYIFLGSISNEEQKQKIIQILLDLLNSVNLKGSIAKLNKTSISDGCGGRILL